MASTSGGTLGDSFESGDQDEFLDDYAGSDFSFGPSEDLYHKNTQSFQCLHQQEISRSSIFRDPLYLFPDFENPNLEHALWGQEPLPQYDNIGCERYKDLCKKLGVIPYRRVLKSLASDRLDLKFYGLQLKEMHAICETLQFNSFVKHVTFQENVLIPESVKYISDMIEQTNTLLSLDLKHCQIGRLGACYLNNGLSCANSLTELDLSYNDIGDEGMENMAYGLRYNVSLKKLNLSHNSLGERALIALGPAIEDNYVLTDLDLSWNYCYTPAGLAAFMSGLANNLAIKSLNLSWNGISEKEAVRPILMYFKNESSSVEHINLSNNRLSGIPLKMIRTGIMNTEGLLTLDISYNPMTAEEAEFFAKVLVVSRVDSPTINTVNFGSTWVNKSFLELEEKIEENELHVFRGGVLSNYEIKGPDEKALLLERAKFLALKPKKKKAKRDIGQFVLGLSERPMKIKKFVALLKKQRIKLDLDLLDGFIEKWADEKKYMNIQDMKDTYLRMYPDTKIPIKKKTAKSKMKKPDEE